MPNRSVRPGRKTEAPLNATAETTIILQSYSSGLSTYLRPKPDKPTTLGPEPNYAESTVVEGRSAWKALLRGQLEQLSILAFQAWGFGLGVWQLKV